MLTFNDILLLEGLEPKSVRLVKHQDKRAPLYETWRTKPRLLERYQAIQRRDVFRVGDRLASFVVTPQPWRETLFIGMFLVRDVQRAAKGTTDPILGIDATGLYHYKITRLKSCSTTSVD
jgi:hypothetical protein